MKNSTTLDLGCGIGRDTAWLNDHHFPSEGIDASESMIAEAKKDHSRLKFSIGSLPALKFEDKFINIYCCAVLMHVPRSHLLGSLVSILKAMKVNGRLIMSYRDGNNGSDERLFESYQPGQIAQLFESLGGKVLLIEQDGIWHNLVIEKSDISKKDGLQQIQEIITRDKKVATYKFALLRALCEIARYEPHVVTWYREGDMVLVPMNRIAVRWILYYWPLVKNDLRQTTRDKMAFEEMLRDLPYGMPDFHVLKSKLDEDNGKEFQKLISKVSNTIKVGPVQYAGGGKFSIFKYVSKLDASVYSELKDSKQGMITVPISIWRDINHFSHWIEGSLSLQWAELSTKINKDSNFGKHIDLVTRSIQEDVRSTNVIRKLFKNKKLKCVWTGKTVEDYAVDHMIPWSLWRNNDLWNLLPSNVKINGAKSDLLPSPAIIRKNFDTIREYWEIYHEAFPDLFEPQLKRALGVNIEDGLGNSGLESLEQTVNRIRIFQSAVYWSPESSIA